MERSEGFEPAAHGLLPVRLECWQGFVFLNFDPAAPGLMTALGDLPERLAGYRFAEMACTWRAEIECRCNWKLLVENALEAYHTGMVHRESVGAQREAVIPTRGDWLCLQVLSETSIAVLGDRPPFPQIATLSPEAARGTYFTMIMPTTQFACAQDCMWWLALRPLGPARTLLSLGGCFPKATTALPGFAANAQPYYARWERVAREDVAMLERQQEGLASPLYRPGRLSWRDALVHEVHRWLAARVPAELWAHLRRTGRGRAARAVMETRHRARGFALRGTLRYVGQGEFPSPCARSSADRALPSGGKGQRFESPRARQLPLCPARRHG